MRLKLTKTNLKGNITKEQARVIMRALRGYTNMRVCLVLTKELVQNRRPYVIYLRLLPEGELRHLGLAYKAIGAYDTEDWQVTLTEGTELLYSELQGVLTLPQIRDFLRLKLDSFRVGDVVNFSFYRLTIQEIGSNYIKLVDTRGVVRQYDEATFLRYYEGIHRYVEDRN